MSTPKPLFNPSLEEVAKMLGIPTAMALNYEGNASTLNYAEYERELYARQQNLLREHFEAKHLRPWIEEMFAEWRPFYLLPLGKKLYKRHKKPPICISWDSEEQK